jgi:hypothetical protein
MVNSSSGAIWVASLRSCVGWVERSDTHAELRHRDGYRQLNLRGPPHPTYLFNLRPRLAQHAFFEQ